MWFDIWSHADVQYINNYALLFCAVVLSFFQTYEALQQTLKLWNVTLLVVVDREL